MSWLSDQFSENARVQRQMNVADSQGLFLVTLSAPFYTITQPLSGLKMGRGVCLLSGVIGTNSALTGGVTYPVGQLPREMAPVLTQIQNSPFGSGGPDFELTVHPDGRLVGKPSSNVGANTGTGIYFIFPLRAT